MLPLLDGVDALRDMLQGPCASLLPAEPVRDEEVDRALEAARERLCGRRRDREQMTLDV